jgi:hypothetical protein
MMSKNVYTKVFLKELGKSTSDVDIQEYLPLWWQNIRENGGLRLTDEGFNIINQIELAMYDIPFPLDMPITSQVIIFLDKFIDCPYYVTKTSIWVTGERKAVELTLFSGDIRKYGIAKALSRSRKSE